MGWFYWQNAMTGRMAGTRRGREEKWRYQPQQALDRGQGRGDTRVIESTFHVPAFLLSASARHRFILPTIVRSFGSRTSQNNSRDAKSAGQRNSGLPNIIDQGVTGVNSGPAVGN